MIKKSVFLNYKTFIHVFFILFTLTFILPLILVISASFTNEDFLSKGYSLIPLKFDTMAYEFAFENPMQIIDAYYVTAFQAFVGTFLSVLIMALCAYPLSRQSFKLKKIITSIILFTMLFGGGLIPSYILINKYLHLGNTIWVYIFPGLVNGFSIIVFRTFFQGLPHSLAESAKIDGASEMRIFFQIILPLSKPVVATLALFGLLDRWNNWYTSLIYIRETKLYTLQYLLQKLLLDAEFLKNSVEQMMQGNMNLSNFKAPSESFKYAMCVIVAGPMLVVFPFFQKYFAKGLTVGSVKG